MTRQASFTSDFTLVGEMDVVGGDNLRVIARQSSGVSLNLSSIGTYVRVELI